MNTATTAAPTPEAAPASPTNPSSTAPKTVWRAYQGVSPTAVDEKDLQSVLFDALRQRG